MLFQIRAVLSSLAVSMAVGAERDRSHRPSCLRVKTCTAEAVSHKRTSPLRAAVARRVPSGLKASDKTGASCWSR